MKQLHLEQTCTSAEEGDELMEGLADGPDVTTLERITIIDERAWFDSGREECLVPFVAMLARQTELKKLKMRQCYLNETQKKKIRDTLAETDCEFDYFA